MKLRRAQAFGGLIVLCAASGPALAQTVWTGTTSSDWFTPGNWNNGVPTAGTDAKLDTVTPNPTVIGTPGAATTNLQVGLSSTGQLTIGGGTLASSTGTLGLSSGSQGAVTVTGAGSTWTSTGNIVVGSGGAGTLTIANGGSVTAAALQLAVQAGSRATLNIGAGAGSLAAAPGTLNTASVSFGAGTGTINFNHTSTNYVFAPTISGAGSVNVLAGSTSLTGANSYTGGTTLTGGRLSVAADQNLGAATGGLTFNGGTLQFANSFTLAATRAVTMNAGGGTFDTNGNDVSFGGSFSGPGGLTKTGAGTLTLTLRLLSSTDGYSGPTNIVAGTLRAGNDLVFAQQSAFTVAAGATLDLNSHLVNIASLAGAGNVTLGNQGGLGLSGFHMGDTTFSGVISGSGTVSKFSDGTLTLSGTNTYSGVTVLGFGGLRLSGAGTLGLASNSLQLLSPGSTLDLGGTSQTQNGGLSMLGGTIANGTLASSGTFQVQSGNISAALAGTGSFVVPFIAPTLKVVLSGTNTYTGNTTVGGMLQVDGSIASSALTTVNSAFNIPGVLSGTGTVGTTLINGGILAPGTVVPGLGTTVPGPLTGTPGTLTVAGNLAFTSGALYLVQVNGATASLVNVNGTAALAGNVQAVFTAGSSLSKQYTILHSAGLGGTTFDGLKTVNLANFVASLSYTNTDVVLNLVSTLGPRPPVTPGGGGGGIAPGAFNGNQQSIANTLNNFFNGGGTLPPGFLNLFALTGTNLSNALTQISGETATASQQTTFDAMSQFMGVMTDPFANRSGGADVMPGARGFAEESASAYAVRKTNDAYAMFTKAPPAAPYQPRWNVWVAGFGGSQSTDGSTATGSNNTSSSIYGTAVGADYQFSPNTVAGFALAGGGTNFSVTNGGSGRSDLFQAGAYVRHTEGAAYVSAGLAYGWQDVTTNRTVTVAGVDQLRAEFNANAYSGRLEGGYRFVTPWIGGIGITPYAAGQFTTFNLPAYAEGAVTGASTFALAYASRSTTDSRSELGIRTDKSFAVSNGVLTLRSRFAWAHDYDPDRSVTGTFQALPGASFVVNGAAQPSNSALTTASVEMKWLNGLSAAATFEGEFSSVTASYAGKGMLRYQW
ncbi:autotransporter domain-containing protein [Bradyrhizobium sp. Pear77]|uniref:autotransporter outer membrane beta-barrel domain-containing protein n=1 Tax=Bradyrhizobium altum TaxID=1571202 RepID=UPI001E6365ED|nr:autotransporter domain-containing protein [Bradyrhizobium altum]MCC8956343.1 autotransporter domain-containing protein [Bradyrhizobium altum]